MALSSGPSLESVHSPPSRSLHSQQPVPTFPPTPRSSLYGFNVTLAVLFILLIYCFINIHGTDRDHRFIVLITPKALTVTIALLF